MESKYKFSKPSEDLLNCGVPSLDEIKDKLIDFLKKETIDQIKDNYYDNLDYMCDDDIIEEKFLRYIDTEEGKNKIDTLLKKKIDNYKIPSMNKFSNVFSFDKYYENMENVILRFCASKYSIPKKALKFGLLFGLTDYDNIPRDDYISPYTDLPYGYWYFINKEDEYVFALRKIEIDYNNHVFHKLKISVKHFRNPYVFVQYHDDEKVWDSIVVTSPLPPLEPYYVEVEDMMIEESVVNESRLFWTKRVVSKYGNQSSDSEMTDED